MRALPSSVIGITRLNTGSTAGGDKVSHHYLVTERNFFLNLLKVSGVLGRKERLYRDLTATAVSLP